MCPERVDTMASAASPTRDSTSTQPLIVPDPGTSTAAAVVLDSFARAASNTDSLGPWEYAALHAGAALKGAEAGAVDGVDGLADAVGMLLTPETEKSACDWTPAQEDSRRHSCCCCCLSGEAEARPVRLVPGFDDEDGKVAQLHVSRGNVFPGWIAADEASRSLTSSAARKSSPTLQTLPRSPTLSSVRSPFLNSPTPAH